MRLPGAARDVIGDGANATLVTVNPDGSPHVSVVWVGVSESSSGDELLIAHLGEYVKVRNMRADPSVLLTIVDNDHFYGLVRPYLRVTGTATVTPGGAPELLAKLAKILGNPTVVFPPPNAPAGYTTRIRIDKIGGSGPWRE